MVGLRDNLVHNQRDMSVMSVYLHVMADGILGCSGKIIFPQCGSLSSEHSACHDVRLAEMWIFEESGIHVEQCCEIGA